MLFRSLVLAHGADINSRPDYATPPHTASLQSHVERPVDGSLEETKEIESGLQYSIMHYENESGFTPLHIAVKEGHFDMCKMLLEHEADVHAQDSKGNIPLHSALSGGHLEIARILLEHNAEVNSRNDNGSTPLLLASERGSPHLMQLLLDRNADVHVHDADGDTPLHCAAIAGRLEEARLLLALKVEVNSRNNQGSTPLHLASEGYEEGDPDIVQLLLGHGADTQARNFSGKTASEVARGPKQQEIVQLLSDHAAE